MPARRSFPALIVMITIALLLTSCDRPVGPSDTPSLNVLLVSGDQQTGAAGLQVAQPLVVKVLQPNGKPFKGQVVNFRVKAGGGSVFAGSAITDDRGLAQELWTLGPRAGDPQRVEVRSVDQRTGDAQIHGVFTATSVPGAPARIAIVRGDNQTVSPSATAQTPPTVRVTDTFDNPTPGIAVSFTPDARGGTTTPATATTNARGTATVSWQVGSGGQQQQLNAAIGGGVNVTFRAFVFECNCWFLNTAMPTAASDFTAVGADGKIYVMGGAKEPFQIGTMQIYDAHGDAWTTKSLPTVRRGHGAAAVDGVIYVMGGWNDQQNLTSVEAYDIATDTWTSRAPMPAHRRGLSAVAVDGIVYAIGGHGAEGLMPRLEAYNPATDTWTRKADMPFPRYEFGVAAVGGKIYVVGGLDQLTETNTVQAYDPATDTWSIKAPMPTSRWGLEAAQGYGRLYALGGRSDNRTLSLVEIYNPETDSWGPFDFMPNIHQEFGAVMLDGFIYVMGGNDQNLTRTSKVESFLP